MDRRLRELERRLSTDPSARVQWFLERRRTGQLDEHGLEVAAFGGDEGARQALGRPVELESVGDKDLARLKGLGPVLELRFDSQKISRWGLSSVATLESVRALGVRNTLLGDDGLAPVLRMGGLTVLDLWSTAVGSETVAGLGALKSLRGLNLGGGSFTSPSWEVLGELPLQRLCVDYVGLGQSLLDGLGLVGGLEWLRLSWGRGGEGLDWSGLAGLSRLTHLDLRGVRVSQRALEALRELPALTHVDLGWTRIGDAELRVLEGVRWTHVDLRHTRVTERSRVVWESMPLKWLNLHGTEVPTEDRGLGGDPGFWERVGEDW